MSQADLSELYFAKCHLDVPLDRLKYWMTAYLQNQEKLLAKSKLWKLAISRKLPDRGNRYKAGKPVCYYWPAYTYSVGVPDWISIWISK